MRRGNRIDGVIVWAMVALAFSTATQWGLAGQRVQPVPLGGRLDKLSGDQHYGVFVPTRFGGMLTVKTTDGTVEGLTGPDGRPQGNGEEVGDNQQGWYTFRITGSKAPYTIETTFVQVAQAARLPWNFYYWPTKGDSIHEPWAGGNGRVDTGSPAGDDVMVAQPGSYIAPGQDIVLPGNNGLLETRPAQGDTSTWFPNLYDDLTFLGAEGTLYTTPSPMLKYDQLFGTSARQWEATSTQNKDIKRWPGHCLGGAIASISINEPTPAPGSGFTRDELKALWAELGENHYNHTIGDNVNNIPAGPPRPGPDATDSFVPRFHNMLETHIRGRKKAVLANLRAFPPNGTADEVWNHGVGKYTAKFHSVPGRGERAVRIELELVANSGSNLNNSDNKPRINTYEYTLVYGMSGGVDETQPGTSDWISVGGEAIFAPLNVMEVVSSRWQGHNPMITESNIRAVDMANGGSLAGRFAGTPPQFRPVFSMEGGPGRGASFAFGSRDGLNVPSPRGRLFGRFFGR